MLNLAAVAAGDLYITIEIPVVGIDVNGGLLADAHVRQLIFLVVCGHPNVAERHHRQQLLARLHTEIQPPPISFR